MINEDILKGKWKEIKGEIITQWGNLTDNELDKSSGNMLTIAGLIQQRYGAKREEVLERLNGILAKFSDRTEDVKDDLRDDSAL